MSSAKNNLLQTMSEAFSEDEIRTICFNMDIEFEDIPASLGKTGKIRELILLCQGSGRLKELIEWCKKEIPHIDWPDGDTWAMEELVGEEPESREPFEPETITVLGCTFMMGGSKPFEVTLEPYRLGKHPVTNAEYYYYLQHINQTAPSELNWRNGTVPALEQETEPVCGITWKEAMAYCAWLSAETGKSYTLPSEAQWENAAGVEGDPFKMIDYAREWTTTLWGEKRRRPDKRYQYPYQPHDGRENLLANDQTRRVTRGASAQITERGSELPTKRGLSKSRIGFRVAINKK